MSIIKEDLPDYKFTQGWSATCNGQSYRIPVGERIDDLRIYVTKAEVAGTASYPGVFRMTPKLPVLGCIEVRGDDLDVNLHEMGHTLGIGIGMIWDDLIQDPNGDIHFNGPLAIAAFNDAGGWDYTGAKVPVTKGGGHWRFGGRSHFIESDSFDELMEPWTFDRYYTELYHDSGLGRSRLQR